MARDTNEAYSSYEQRQAAEKAAREAAKMADLKKKIKLGLYAGGGVLGLILFCAIWPFTSVGPGNRGVVTHFGKVQNEILDEGLHMVTPFMTTVKEISVKVQKSDVQSEASSKDLQLVDTHVVVNWSLPAAKVNWIYQTIGNEQAVLDNIISPAINEVFKAATAKKTAEGIIAQRNELTDDISAMLIERLKKYDITVRDISLVDLKFSADFNKAIEEKQVAEQEAKKFVYVAQKAEQESAAKVNIAKGNKESEIIEAEGKAQAQKLLESSLTPAILQKIALDKWDGSFPQVMGSGGVPFLNIDINKKQGETK